MQRLTQDFHIGPYKLLALLEKGEYSAVYQAQHVMLESLHAFKLIHSDVDMAIMHAVPREARMQAKVYHRNVLRITDAGSWRDRPFVVVDWVDGVDLGVWLDEHGAMEIGRALSLFREIVRGTMAVHAADLVHRDLKPSNILLVKNGSYLTPKIADFGLAKEIKPGMEPTALGLSVEYKTLGTPEYMAPEQSGRAGEVDLRADLWSLGCILYEMLADAVPFEAEKAWDVMLKARLGKYKPLLEHRPDAPPELESVIADLLQTDPDKRLGDCMTLLRRLDGVG